MLVSVQWGQGVAATDRPLRARRCAGATEPGTGSPELTAEPAGGETLRAPRQGLAVVIIFHTSFLSFPEQLILSRQLLGLTVDV